MTTRPVPVMEGLPECRAAFEGRYLKRHRPVVLRGAAPRLVPKAWQLFHDDAECLTELGAILTDAVVDVAVTHWSQPFQGDPGHAESTRLPFPDFLRLLRGAPASDEESMAGFEDEKGSPWDRQNFYLAQSSILERPRKGGGPSAAAPPLAALAPHIDLPDALVDPRDVMTVNLWMGGKPTATTLHYDSNHNLLVVLRGTKQVQLFPPSATPQLEPCRIYTASANHSTLIVPAEVHDLFHAPRIENCSLEPWLARLDAGDVLFLPQGWWHQVDSSTRTVALNYWVAGFVEQVLDGGVHREDEEPQGEGEGAGGDDDEMLPFYLRAVLQRAVERERNRMVEAAVGKALAECRRALGRGDMEDELSAADWRVLVDKACALCPTTPSPETAPAPALMHAVLCAMPFATQLAELPRAVETLGLDRWLGAVLMKLEPITVEVLTTGWEGEVEAPPERVQAFFHTIYGHDRVNSRDLFSTQEYVKMQLFRSKSLLAKEAMNKALGL